MQLDVGVAGRKVVVFGDLPGARRSVLRFARAGATVTVAAGGPVLLGQRLAGVRYVPRPDPADTAELLRLVGPAWLVVLVGAPARLAERVSELADNLRVLLLSEEPAEPTGAVTLVGGGPGRLGLLTLDACAALREADTVFVDRLAPTTDLARLAPAAELVDVGKSPYHHPVTQRSIEELMVERARRGESVVRLKGGDPYVFGRGGEELTACLAAGVPVRVVPGVSSAVAVPGAAGVPVTHRGLSRSFTAISGHVPLSAEELAALVALGGTIVVLMGVANLAVIVAGLARAGLALGTPAAIVERGCSDSQRSTFTTLGRLAPEAQRRQVESPAVVVIGAVVTVAPGWAAAQEWPAAVAGSAAEEIRPW